MAARTRGGTGGLVATLIISLILNLGLLVAVILVYTQLDGKTQEWEKGRTDVARANREKTEALNENETLIGVILGDTKAKKDLVETRTKELDLKTSLVQAVLDLRRERATLQEEVQKAQASRDQLARNLDQAAAEVKRYGAGLNQAEAALAARVKGLEEQQKAYETTVASERSRLDARIGELQAKYQKDTTDLKAEVDRLNTENGILRDRLTACLASKPGMKGPDVTLLADGQLVEAGPDAREVYINLGRRQHLTLGTTFVVYPRGSRVPTDPNGEPKPGKAVIEVIGLGESTATCRVVSVDRGQALVEGDMIANAAYDPNMIFRVYVFGDFDLDYVGQASVADRKRVESMVTQWGGKLAEDLTYETDLMVLGVEPKMPEPLGKDVRDPVQIEEQARRMRAWQDYQRRIAQAKSYGIPVLNQNRFLALIGYYQR